MAKSNIYDVFKYGGENGLITAPGELHVLPAARTLFTIPKNIALGLVVVDVWKKHRRFIKPSSYSARGVEQFLAYFNRETSVMMEDLEKLTAATNREFELWEPISKATFNMILGNYRDSFDRIFIL